MMGRLRDQIDDSDPTRARAAQLLAAVPVVTESELAKERVRRRVLQREVRRSVLFTWLRPTVVIAILLVTGVATAATIGRPLMARAYRRLIGGGQPSQAGLAAPFERLGLVAPPLAPKPLDQSGPIDAPRAPGPTMPAAPLPPDAVVPGPVESAMPGEHRAAGMRRSAAPSVDTREPKARIGDAPPPQASASTVASAPPAAAQENIIVLAAVRALRREHDPRRAGELLETYLRRYPNGTLVEEAMALAIEAAKARRDPRTASLAQAYLRRFPAGRFQQAARAAAATP